MTSVRTIPLALIDAGERLRALDPAWVALLAEEITADGLQEPIRVVERGDRFQLVAGARRLAAATALGRTDIEARIVPATALADETSVRLAEIKADMLRGELTALDHAVYVAAWCDIYREAQGPQKRGPKPAQAKDDEALEQISANLALNWTEAAQNALGIGRRSVFRSLKIGAIGAELRRRIALLPVATKQTELLLLAEESEARQAAIVDMLTAEPARAVTVAEAIMLLGGATAAPRAVTAYERIHERFTTLKPAEKVAFFDLNASEIEEWWVQRTAATRRNAA